jgi:Ni,Fe-hydrogenase III small subunit
MFFVLKQLWKYGLGTLPVEDLRSISATATSFTPDNDNSVIHSDKSVVDELDQLQERASLTIKKIFEKSLHIRHLDSGSTNACEWEMSALLNPVYDVQRFGIDFVASPRHADMLLITGGVTRNLEEAVRKTYDAVPSPKMVVAVGNDACGLGLIGKTYANYGGVDQIIPVNVYVPGDPPSPIEILKGILKAVEQQL